MADGTTRHWADVDIRLEAHFGDRVVSCFSERPTSFHDLLADAARRLPDQEALVDADERLTWREVTRRVAAIGGGLLERGVRPGDRVALLIGNCNAFVLSLFAIARIGAVAVPLGTRQQRPEIVFALENCGAKLLISDAGFADRVPSRSEAPRLACRVTLGKDDGAHRFADLLAGAPCDPVPVDEQDTAAILYTSGTTGRPKGAMLTHLGIVHSAMVYVHCMRLTSSDRCVNGVPLSHVTGLIASVAAMARCGGRLIIMPDFRAATFLPLASRERMTYTLMVPAMYNLCLLQPNLRDHDLSAWRIGGFGGAPMPPATITALAEKLPGLTLMNIYGSTETTSPVSLTPPGLIGTHGDTVGVAAPGADLIVVDDLGRELPPDEVGEIWIRGPSVVKGYWDNPSATASELTGGFWHSGDLGTLDRDGFLRVVDRKKDMVNRGGHKIYTAEVEAVLASHPAVIESAVIGRPCPVLGERVHAVVVVRGEAASAEDIRAFCAERLSDYKVPETMDVGLDPLPRNGNSKIMKRVLRERMLGVPS